MGTPTERVALFGLAHDPWEIPWDESWDRMLMACPMGLYDMIDGKIHWLARYTRAIQ